jgi:glycosyltransferase involved in cell wall biosynthesis
VASSFHTNFDHYAAHYGFLGLEWLAFLYLCWFHNRCAVTLVPSLQTQRRLTAAGVQRVELWTRGVDGNLFNPRHRDPQLRHDLGLEEDDPLLVYVGRLAPEKNLQTLLSAFSRLRQGGAPANRAKLALVGSGPLEEALRPSTPTGVILAGEQTGAALSRWYASGDIFAFPSLSETFGNVVLEAQASGLPVVGFDTQGVNEQVKQGENGYLVPEWGDLKPYLERLCQDAALRRSMGEAARRRAERHDWKPIFDELEQRYLGLVKEAAEARAALAGGAV